MNWYRRLALRLAFGRRATMRGIVARVIEHALARAGCSRNEAKKLTAAVIPALSESGFFSKEDLP